MISISPFRFNGTEVTIDPEILIYDIFKKVYDIDTSTKKELALQYFIYIYHRADQRAIPIMKGYSDKDQHKFACEQAKLDIKFKPDIRIVNAIDFYKENFISPVKALSLKILSTLQKNIKILDKANDLIEEALEKELTPEKVDSLIKLSNSISKMATEFVSQIKTIKELDIAISSIDNEEGIIQRGGKKLKSSMDRRDGI